MLSFGPYTCQAIYRRKINGLSCPQPSSRKIFCFRTFGRQERKVTQKNKKALKSNQKPLDLRCHGANPSIVFGAIITIVCRSGSAVFRSVCTSGKWQFTRTGKHEKKSLFPRIFLHVHEKRPRRNFFRQGLIFYAVKDTWLCP